MSDSENDEEVGICLPVPGNTPDEGVDFLESFAAGSVGASIKMTTQGTTIPQIRTEYKILISHFERHLQSKMSSGLPADEIARWAVAERTRIANQMRGKQGVSAKIILELRDARKYGVGGRSYENLAKRALKSGVEEIDLPAHLLISATKPNKAISDAAVEGAKFLKHGGKAVVVVSISMTAYTLLTAPEGQLERLIYQEIGGAAGGFLGGGAGVGLCIVFGVATSGWGLLACGVVGGGAGGYVGSKAGDKVYLLKGELQSPTAVMQGGGFQQIGPDELLEDITATRGDTRASSEGKTDMGMPISNQQYTFGRPSLGHRNRTSYPVCEKRFHP